MSFRTLAMLAGSLILGWLLAATPAAALEAKNLQELRIVGHHFTTTISGARRTIATSDPAKGRYLVLKVAATSPEDNAVVFATDFALVYFRGNGQEERAACDALGLANSAAPGEFTYFIPGTVPRITLARGAIHFGLAFWVESDVTAIALHRFGTGPVIYRIGEDRLYSVNIYTQNDTRLLSEAKKVIQDGAYNVVWAAETLAKAATGITIHYAEPAESHAREISQRLIRKLGGTPTLKKAELTSDVDVVVWLGK
jgi:hypothetical protein